MARTYNIEGRKRSSYETYKRNVSDLRKQGYAVAKPLTYKEYGKIFEERRQQGARNTAREVARQVNIITTKSEAKEIIRTIKTDIKSGKSFDGAPIEKIKVEDLLNEKELLKLKGRSKWNYLHALYGDSKEGYRRAHVLYG